MDGGLIIMMIVGLMVKLDELDVDEKGFMVGFRPESEGITLEEAFKIVYEKERI